MYLKNIKNNWSFDKMAELIDKLMPKDLKAQPKNVGIQLPKLKKVNNTKDTPTKMPKLKLPKLNKIEA